MSCVDKYVNTDHMSAFMYVYGDNQFYKKVVISVFLFLFFFLIFLLHYKHIYSIINFILLFLINDNLSSIYYYLFIY